MEAGDEIKPLSDVEIRVGSNTVRRDEEGRWQKDSVSQRMEVEVFDEKGFSPRIYEDIRNHRSDLNFTLVEETYNISGSVVNQGGEGI